MRRHPRLVSNGIPRTRPRSGAESAPVDITATRAGSPRATSRPTLPCCRWPMPTSSPVSARGIPSLVRCSRVRAWQSTPSGDCRRPGPSHRPPELSGFPQRRARRRRREHRRSLAGRLRGLRAWLSLLVRGGPGRCRSLRSALERRQHMSDVPDRRVRAGRPVPQPNGGVDAALHAGGRDQGGADPVRQLQGCKNLLAPRCPCRIPAE